MAPLRYRQIFHFYWPLVLTSQMMTLTAPIINMGLGRNEDPKIQLAGYSVGFALLLVFNACLFPFLQTVTVLAKGPQSRRSLLIKGLSIGAVIALWELLLAVSPWGDDFIGWAMGSTPAVALLAQKVALVQFPIVLLLPLRSYFSGIVMRHKNTIIISQATGTRLAIISAIIFGAINAGRMPGAMLGASCLTFGIFTETVFMGIRASRLMRRDASGINELELDGHVSWAAFMAFIGPLMINAITWTATRPLINGILGRSSDPDLAQASFGFVFPLLILSASPLWAFQSTTVVLAKQRADLYKLFRFGGVTIAFFVVGIALVVWTPLLRGMLEKVFSLDPATPLFAWVVPALLVIPFQPVTLGLRTISHGFLMSQMRTQAIGIASLIKLGSMAIVGIPLIIAKPDINGALFGTLLLMGAEGLETVIILARLKRLLRIPEQLPVPPTAREESAEAMVGAIAPTEEVAATE